MKVLLLEDNRALANSLGEYLEQVGCEMDYAYSGQACLNFTQQNQYDVLILDIAMPGKNGLEVCVELRQSLKINTPILFLTARDTLEDKLTGFKAGCDDYLLKPFSPEELYHRLLALNARGPRKDIGIQIFGDMVIDHSKQTVTRQGETIALQNTQFQLLKLLLKNSPNIVSKEMLEISIWGQNIPDSDPLRTHMYRLRNLIDKPFNTTMIHTVHGKGYRIETT